MTPGGGRNQAGCPEPLKLRCAVRFGGFFSGFPTKTRAKEGGGTMSSKIERTYLLGFEVWISEGRGLLHLPRKVGGSNPQTADLAL